MRRPTRGEWVVISAATLLLLDLVVVPWHRIRIGLGIAGRISIDKRAIEAPSAIYAIAALFGMALVLVLVVARLTGPQPRRYSPRHLRDMKVLAGVAGGLLLVKLVTRTDFLGPGAWLSLILSAAVFCGILLIQEEQPDRSGSAPPPPAP